jgi:CRP/FNR family cyclic AMP-dependent transcriptional regulator
MKHSTDAEPTGRFPARLLEAIAQHGGVRTYQPRSILVNEGDSTDSLYVVLEGRLKAYTSSEDGRDVVLAEYGRGEFFGELVLDGERRSASVEALETTRCCVVPGAEVRQFMIDQPDFAVHLIRHLSAMVRRLTDQVRSLALQDVYGRLTRLLVEFSEADGDRRILRHALTQADIADRIGASREMVNRVLRELTVGGYISQQSGRIHLLKKLPLAR